MIHSLPNPDPILRKTGNRIQVYRELSADWEVFAAIELIDSGLQDLEWEINPNEAHAEQVEFIEELVKQWNPYAIMTQCIDTRLFGFQPFETIWQSVDGRWIITDLIGKPQEWFNFNKENRLQFISRDHPLGKVIEDPRKFITPTNRASYLNPYGESHYSRCFWPVTFKKGGWVFLMKFAEKFGMPWVVGKQPRGASKKERDKLLTNLHQMVQDAVAVVSDDESVDFPESSQKAASTNVYSTVLNYCDKAINKVILSNEMSMGTSQDGGEIRGNASQNFQVSKQVITKVGGVAEYVINEAIKMVWAVNWEGIPPEFSIYAPKDVQKPLAERDKTLTDQGVKLTKKYYMNAYALAEDEFDLKEDLPESEGPGRVAPSPTPAPQTPAPEETDDGFSEKAKSKRQKFDHPRSCFCNACQKAKFQNFKAGLSKAFKPANNQQSSFADPIEKNSLAGLDELETLIEAAAGDQAAELTQEMFEEQLRPLIDLVNQASGYEDVMTTLATAYPEMKTEELEDRLAKAYFIADIIGRLTEQENQELDDE
jgi:phage gp29-like protein